MRELHVCARRRLRMMAVAIVPGMLAGTACGSLWADSGAYQHTSALALYYSKGEYGENSDTRIRYLPFSHEVARDSWRFKATVPRVEIRGPANVLVNLGNIGGTAGEMASASGVGDVLFNLTYELPAWSSSAPFVDLSVEWKLPTADENKGLGTGKHDAGVQFDLYQMLGQTTLFGSLGYKYRRHSPFFDQLQNSFQASLGVSRRWGETLQYGVIYDYREAVSAFTEDMHELLPYLSWTPVPRWTFMIYAVKGFTDESADRAVGIQMSHRW